MSFITSGVAVFSRTYVPSFPVPDAVTGFVASNPQIYSIDLAWDPALDATLYYLVSSPPMTNFNTSETFFSFTGLDPATEYTFTITPSNAYGNGPPTTSDPISTLIPIPPPPSYVFTDGNYNITTTTLGLVFGDALPYVTSYNVYAYIAGSGVPVGFQNTPTSPYVYTGLQPNYAYYFNVTGVNATGEGNPSANTNDTPTLPEVTGFSVSNPTEISVDLTWDAPDNSVMNKIQWETTTTPFTSTQTALGYNSFPIPYTRQGLDPDTAYTITITPQVQLAGYNFFNGQPVTSDPISTLLPLPGLGTSMYEPTNVTATTMDLSWFEYVPAYATSFNVYAYSVLDGLIGFVNVPISSFSYTYTGLQPDTEYYFTVAGVNATGVGPAGAGTGNTYTLIQVNLAYTGTIETLVLVPGNYRFTMAGGSGPLKSPIFGSGGRSFSEYTVDYTVTSVITIQYAIGQASPGDVGGAGGTYMYDQTNSQWLFVAGGAGTNDFSPNPSENVPGDGSGGAAGSGGGSGAGVISNGSDSTVSAGSGGLTVGNGGTGGAAGTFGDGPQQGGFGGGGGGTRVYDPALPGIYGQYAYYPGGGGGYTGGTTFADYTPGNVAVWTSGFGTSYAIAGATFVGSNSQGDAPVTNGYININP
jgi:hypothetical protein